MPKSTREIKTENKSFSWLSFEELESNFNELVAKYDHSNPKRKAQIEEISHTFNRLKLIKCFSQIGLTGYKNHLKNYLYVKDVNGENVVFELTSDEYTKLAAVKLELCKDKDIDKVKADSQFKNVLGSRLKKNQNLDFSTASLHENYIAEHFNFQLTDADYVKIITGVFFKIKKQIEGEYRLLSPERSELYKLLNTAIGLTADNSMNESDVHLALEALDKFNKADVLKNQTLLTVNEKIINDRPKLKTVYQPTEDHLLYTDSKMHPVMSSHAKIRNATEEEIAGIKKKAVKFFPHKESSDEERYLSDADKVRYAAAIEKLHHDRDLSIFKDKLKLYVLGQVKDFDKSTLNPVSKSFK